MILSYFDVTVDFNEGQSFDCSFDEGNGFDVDLGYQPPQHEYHGSYDVIPTEVAQTLSTADNVLAADIVIEPIPSNYGLITWDGSVITVS